MDTDAIERELRKQLETSIGRPISDDEWASLTGAPPRPAAPAGPRRARRFAEGTAMWIGIVLAWLVAGAVMYGLVLGLLWAYHPAGLEDENEGFLLTALFTGFIVVSAVANWPRAAPVFLGVGLIVGGAALAIGALVKVAS